MEPKRGIDREAAARAIDAFLRAIGRDPAAEPDLDGTGARVAEAFADELCKGYAIDTRAILRSAIVPIAAPSESKERATSLVVVRDIRLVTTCPHHLLLATGTATVAFQPNEKLVGLGAIAAVVDAHARRLTLQERIGERVAAEIEEILAPEWVAVRIVLTHGCMTARGEHAVGSSVETVATRGSIPQKRVAQVYAALGVGR